MFFRVNITRKRNKRSSHEFVVLQMYQVSTKAASALLFLVTGYNLWPTRTQFNTKTYKTSLTVISCLNYNSLLHSNSP